LKSLSPGTTAGDVDYYTSSTAKARLGIGTTGQVLTVAGGVPSWATASSGSQTTLATGSFSSTTISISSINQTYKDLRLYIYDLTNSSAGGAGFTMTLNSDTSALYNQVRMDGSSVTSVALGSNINLGAPINTNPEAKMVIDYLDYTNTTASKSGTFNMYYNDYNGNNYTKYGMWAFKSTSALSSITFTVSSGAFASGTYTLVGIK
jgi:hypothetical protein